MKTIFSPVKQSYLAKIGMLLIVVALVAGIVSCNGVATYSLTMAANPDEGGTATDLTDTSPYAANTTVDIKAVAAACCRFVDWTVSAGEVGNATAAETTFTMPARDVTVTANFEPVPPDHYKFYFAEWQGGEPPEKLPADVQLADQFGAFNATVGDVALFGNPVKKVHGDTTMPISDGDRHYTLYELEYDEGWIPSSFKVTVKNQFQLEAVELTVEGPYFLAVPTRKIEGDHEMPECIDHLLLYMVVHPIEYVPEPIGEVDLYDQFHDELNVTVYEPMFFANPVEKTVLPGGAPTPIEHQDEHYVFYPMDETFEKSGVPITNQFGDQTLDIGNPALLAVPSEKISVEQPLDHFHCYWAEWADEPPMFAVDVQLEDQFITEWLGESLNATVLWPVHFANPVNKGHEVWTPISSWKHHYTFYELSYGEIMLPAWYVVVSNQFDPLGPMVEPPVYQELYVSGYPEYLAVPTQKGDQDMPVNLDHFLVYEVLPEPPYVGAEVYLWDQFTEYWPTVEEAAYFANPVKKTIVDSGEVTYIKNNDHLVLYWIDATFFPTIEDLPIDNQFGPQFLDVWPDEGGDLLGVPSQKIDWSIAD